MVKKQRAQVVMNADEIRDSYAKLPTPQIEQLLIALAPHAEANDSTREFFAMLGAILSDRALAATFEHLAQLRASKTRSASRQFNDIYLTFDLVAQVKFWKFMITTHARSLDEVEHFQRLQQRVQATLANVLGA